MTPSSDSEPATQLNSRLSWLKWNLLRIIFGALTLGLFLISCVYVIVKGAYSALPVLGIAGVCVLVKYVITVKNERNTGRTSADAESGRPSPGGDRCESNRVPGDNQPDGRGFPSDAPPPSYKEVTIALCSFPLVQPTPSDSIPQLADLSSLPSYNQVGNYIHSNSINYSSQFHSNKWKSHNQFKSFWFRLN